MTDKTSWSQMAEKELRGKPLDSLTWDTLEGINVQPIYTADDLKGLEHMDSVAGQAPYTLALIPISDPTRLLGSSYAVAGLKKKIRSQGVLDRSTGAQRPREGGTISGFQGLLHQLSPTKGRLRPLTPRSFPLSSLL